MKESIKTVFQCDYCDKRLFRKDAMVRHEVKCTRNPVNNDACSACAFCETTKVHYTREGYFDGYFTESDHATTGFRCSKLNIELYPHKCIRIGLVEKYPETFEGKQVMPNECEHWNYTTI